MTNSPIGKKKPWIQERQVDNNRPKLGRDRTGMWCIQLQPVADTSVSTNKSPNIPSTQKVTIDSTKYPVPNQLLKEQKYPLQDRYKIETGNIPVNLIHILGLHQGHQIIYNCKV